ncbi:unnamed protein product [Phytomonas sp. EM1]|nr:unnamed protein product [Phytomonas sp. EM1]|eukprot:CCW61851.1 unnamed protein product [Phytomonas sp. isolate EM1]
MKHLQSLPNKLDPARGSSLAHVKSLQLARDEEEKIRMRRIKGTIVLVEQFLVEQGYMNSLQALQQESGVSLQQNCVADNIDLLAVVAEFEQFYELKYQRKPRLFRPQAQGGTEDVLSKERGGERTLVRKLGARLSPSLGGAIDKSSPSLSHSHIFNSSSSRKVEPLEPIPITNHLADAGVKKPSSSRNDISSAPPACEHGDAGKGDKHGGGMIALKGLKIHPHTLLPTNGQKQAEVDDTSEAFYGRALKPLPFFPTNELTDLAQVIMRDILDTNPAVLWSDIAELENAKHLLKEAVVMPVKYPELFEGIMRPWKGIFLFGPPGTGKTLLAKAVATECRTTFFNISASTVVSKWRGDSEKLVRMLFELAVHYAPSTIFIDEIDSLISTRSSEGEHEGSRRMKTELLVQMDGLSKRRGGNIVFVLAASNTPWDLDSAILRRLEKRILVPLPSLKAREEMFHRLLHKNVVVASGNTGAAVNSADDFDWSRCAQLTEGMSGADIDIICREAMMRPIRKLLARLEGMSASSSSSSHALDTAKIERPKVSIEDVEASIACTCSSVKSGDLRRYNEWAKKHGSDMSA